MRSKNKRFIIGKGLAFSEAWEMQYLSKLAAEGWFLESHAFCGFGYRLCKGEKQDLQYCMDYQKLSKEDQEDYLEMFAAAGWKHVMSVGNIIHYFSAPPGIKPIYSDHSTLMEKYRKGKVNLGVSSIIFILLTFLTCFIWKNTEMHIAQLMFRYMFYFFLVVTLPIIMTYLAFILRLWRLRQLSND